MTEHHDSTPQSPADSNLTGRRIGDYLLLRRLGHGAMADVYLARQESLQRQVAVKVLKAELARDRSYVDRFNAEARAAALLVHPHIVQIHEVGRVEGVYFITQEYVAGGTLQHLLQRLGPLPCPVVLRILLQATSALIKAAEHGIVHRDIKPENIMLTTDGQVKVADFGLARVSGGRTDLTTVGVTMGTPLYMSPEQVEGRPLDSRSDIYSLGVTAYQMLSGHPPFEAETPLALAVKHIRAEPVPLRKTRPDLSDDVCELVHHMLAKSPDDRPGSPQQLAQTIKSLLLTHADEESEGLLSCLPPLRGATEETIAATQRLAAVMHTDTLARHAGRKKKRGWIIATLVSLFAGALLAWGLKESWILGPDTNGLTGPRDDVWAQLYYAKLSNTESTWKSVATYFPSDRFPNGDQDLARRLAEHGLAWYYFDHEKYREALQVFKSLSREENRHQWLRAFGLAGICIIQGSNINQGGGSQVEFENAYSQLGDVKLLDKLRDADLRMATLLDQVTKTTPDTQVD